MNFVPPAVLGGSAPNLHTLEVRTLLCTNRTRVADSIREAGKFKYLRHLTVTFDWPDAIPDRAILAAARELMRNSPATGVKQLVVRQVAENAQGVTRDGSEDDRLFTNVCETFTN